MWRSVRLRHGLRVFVVTTRSERRGGGRRAGPLDGSGWVSRGVFDRGDLIAAVDHFEYRLAAFADWVGGHGVVMVPVTVLVAGLEYAGEDAAVG